MKKTASALVNLKSAIHQIRHAVNASHAYSEAARKRQQKLSAFCDLT